MNVSHGRWFISSLFKSNWRSLAFDRHQNAFEDDEMNWLPIDAFRSIISSREKIGNSIIDSGNHLSSSSIIHESDIEQWFGGHDTCRCVSRVCRVLPNGICIIHSTDTFRRSSNVQVLTVCVSMDLIKLVWPKYILENRYFFRGFFHFPLSIIHYDVIVTVASEWLLNF